TARYADWRKQLADWRAQYPFRYHRGGAVKPQYVIERLREAVKDRDAIFTTGVGQHQMWAAQYLHSEGPRRFITSGGLGTMGFGFPAALRAQRGRARATAARVARLR